MSFYFAGILRIMLLEANAALLVSKFRRPPQRWGLLLVTALSIVAWTKWSAGFRPKCKRSMIRK